eukprot:365828-Chlamydomonas_euryale.AAC.4
MRATTATHQSCHILLNCSALRLPCVLRPPHAEIICSAWLQALQRPAKRAAFRCLAMPWSRRASTTARAAAARCRA